MADIVPQGNVNVSHDELRNPRVDELILTLEREVIEEDADPEDAWTRVTDVWFPEGRWRRFIEATLQRHGEAFRP